MKLEIPAGFDHFSTVQERTYFDLPAIPAGFFGADSDAIATATRIPFGGVPTPGLGLAARPFQMGGAWPASMKLHCVAPRDFTDKLDRMGKDLSPPTQPDTIVQRQAVVLPDIGSTATTSVKVVRLGLMSALPLRVGYRGGRDCELFTIVASLGPLDQQAPGELVLERTSRLSGVASSRLPIRMQIAFFNLFNAGGPAPAAPLHLDVEFTSQRAPWIFTDGASRQEIDGFIRRVVEHILDAPC